MTTVEIISALALLCACFAALIIWLASRINAKPDSYQQHLNNIENQKDGSHE